MTSTKKFISILLLVFALAALFAMPSHAIYLTQTNGIDEKFYLNLYGNSMYNGRKLSVYYTTSPGADQSFLMKGDGFLRPIVDQTYAVNRSTQINTYFSPNLNYAIVWPINLGRVDSQFSIASLSTGYNEFQLLDKSSPNYILTYALLLRPSSMSSVDYANGAFYAYFGPNKCDWRGEY